MTGIAFVGTGFVADYYMTTLANYPELTLRGVWDHAPAQLDRFCAFYKVRRYNSLADVLADSDVEIIINLTTPESHFLVSKAAFEAGKHVYSEKPLAETYDEASALLALSRTYNRILASAPANALTPLHGAVDALIKTGAIGKPKLVYAQMEDGAVFRDAWRTWRSVSGAAWPGEHEFEIGCTLEHVVYAISWLVSLLGPVSSLTAYSALCFPDKGQSSPEPLGPDFSVAVLNFRNGAVCRLTTGLCAPKDRSLTIMGDAGTITVDDLWDYNSHARIERAGEARSLTQKVAGRLQRRFGLSLGHAARPGRPVDAARSSHPKLPGFPSQIDFAAGIAAVAAAINGGPMPFMSGGMVVHTTEVALAISNAGRNASPYTVFSQP
jgi:predicted dehydrogenase